MRIALTGATGFVGKALLPLLSEAGHEVVVLVRKPSAKLGSSVRIVQGGLQDEDALRKFTTSVDLVVHVAGVVSAVNRQAFFAANVEGTVALVKAARENKVKRFVHVSSLAAREPNLNYYGESKAAAETALQDFAKDFSLAILRPAAVYGPGDTATLPLLKSLLSATAIIPGTTSARFGMVHVRDVARLLVEAASSNAAGTFEVDDGSGGHSWPELIDVTRQAFGLPNRVIYIPRGLAMTLGVGGDVIAQLRGKPSLLGRGQLRQIYHADWRVSGATWPMQNFIPLSQGLPETIRWYQAQGLLPLHGAADRRPSPQDKTP
jgi:nucleoside-diphosphate-sugar epimerase